VWRRERGEDGEEIGEALLAVRWRSDG
jgi:hypothetical protein